MSPYVSGTGMLPSGDFSGTLRAQLSKLFAGHAKIQRRV